VAAWGGFLWLLLVIVCVGAMSWTGLVRFGKDVLGLPEPLCYGVPISLDGAAVTLAFFALRGVLSGGAAGLPRLLAILVVCASSGFNYWQARQTGQGGAAELFFAGMSILTYVMFEVVLRHQRREHLAALGAIEPPLARFRVARWLRFPVRTWRAWSVAIDQGLTDPRAALAEARKHEGVLWRLLRTWRDRKEVTPPPVAEPEPASNRLPDPSRRPRNEDARATTRRLLLEHGEDLKARQVAEATGLSRSRGQQLIVSEKAALQAAAARRNGDGGTEHP
jgi:hypothetical protein